MSKNKTKLRWEYVTEPFDVYVNPRLVKRVHSPLERSLSPYYANESYLHLRPCVQGVDEYGAVVKYLYCTRDGRFFVRGKNKWDEVIPSNFTNPRPRNNKNAGGSFNAPSMSNFGHKYCHRCIAVAWCNPPKEALAEINGGHTKKKWEVDHLNTDHKNWSADNLQWITTDENRRRAKIAHRMRQIALDPKFLTSTLCRDIYTLPEECIDEFIYKCSQMFANDPSPLTAKAICLDVVQVLDNIKSQILNDK